MHDGGSGADEVAAVAPRILSQFRAVLEVLTADSVGGFHRVVSEFHVPYRVATRLEFQ